MLITGIQENMLEALAEHDYRRAAKLVQAALKLIREEGLIEVSADVHESLARIYWAMGDWDLARHWARTCVDLRSDWDVLEPVNRTVLLDELMSSFGVFDRAGNDKSLS